MLNKLRVIELKSFIATDHASSPILVTMTMQAFATNPYTVSVQWEDDNTAARSRSYTQQHEAESNYSGALGYVCFHLNGCKHYVCGVFGQPMVRDFSAESRNLYGPGSTKETVPDYLKKERLAKEDSERSYLQTPNPYVPSPEGWVKPLPRGRFFNFEDNSEVRLEWDPKKLATQLDNTTPPGDGILSDTRKDFADLLRELRGHADGERHYLTAATLLKMQTCGRPWIRGWAGEVVAMIVTEVPDGVLVKEPSQSFRSNVRFSPASSEWVSK